MVWGTNVHYIIGVLCGKVFFLTSFLRARNPLVSFASVSLEARKREGQIDREGEREYAWGSMNIDIPISSATSQSEHLSTVSRLPFPTFPSSHWSGIASLLAKVDNECREG